MQVSRTRFPPGCLILVALCFVACTETPVTGRRAFIVTSEAEETRLGEEAYRQALREKRESSNSRWKSVLGRVGKRIADTAEKPGYQWEFRVIEDQERNAFALPGGKVAVTSGMMEFVENEAQLAAIVGHEVAHATARHGGQRITLNLGTQIGFAALQAILDGAQNRDKALLLSALGLGAQVGAILPFSRTHESEADEIGLVYMVKAGYEPTAAVEFWDRFARESQGGPEFLSTHPSNEHRMQDLQRQLPRVTPLYEQSPRYGKGEILR